MNARSLQNGIRVGASAVIVRDAAIVLVEYGAGWQPHFNLPGGGIEQGEAIVAGLRREVREETGAEVSVGPLLLALEYFPPFFDFQYGERHELRLVFRCELVPGSEPHLPPTPDPHQVAVRWVPLEDLPAQPLIPPIAERLLALITAPPAHNPFRDHV